jgi:hypothetical protein
MDALYGTQTDAFGFFRSARRKGPSAAPCLYRWLETDSSQTVTEGRPQSTPVDAKARKYAYRTAWI